MGLVIGTLLALETEEIGVSNKLDHNELVGIFLLLLFFGFVMWCVCHYGLKEWDGEEE